MTKNHIDLRKQPRRLLCTDGERTQVKSAYHDEASHKDDIDKEITRVRKPWGIGLQVTRILPYWTNSQFSTIIAVVSSISLK